MLGTRRIDYRRMCHRVAIATAAIAALSAIFLQSVIATPNLTNWFGETLLSEMFVSMRVNSAAAAAALAFALWIKRRSVVGQRIFATLNIVVLVFAVWWIDRAVGVFFPPAPAEVSVLAPHAKRGWSLKPGVSGTESGTRVRTNRQGLRGPEIESPKPATEHRILFLGDSIIFGFGLPEEDGIVAQTQASLNTPRAARTRVCINAGVSGYATWQERAFLEEQGFALQPDVVVLGVSLQNDVADEVLSRPGEFAGTPLRFEFSSTSHWSGILRAFNSIRAKRQWNAQVRAINWQARPDREALFKSHGSFKAVFTEPMMEEFKAARDRVLGELSKIAEGCAARHIPFALLIFSPRARAEPNMEAVQPERAFAAWAAENAVPMLDVHAFLNTHCTRNGLDLASLYIDESHFTSRGSALIAREVADFLKKNGLVPMPPPQAPSP